MKLHLSSAVGQNLFTGYGEGYVSVNHQRYQHPVLVSSGYSGRWDAPSFEGLTPAHFEALLRLEPEIVILGTGSTLRFPNPELVQALVNAAIGFEAMDTKAACRTYNILVGEGRQVVAALLI